MEIDRDKMTGEDFANYVMKQYNSQLCPNVFGDTRPKMRKNDKCWKQIKQEHENELNLINR